jgi:prenyl protein peptidase
MTDEAPSPPPITTGTASILLVLYALLYFLPFYASSSTRPSPTLSRDAPSVIRARIRSVTISCFFCLAATAIILTSTAGASPSGILHLTGIWPPALPDTLRVLSLTALLFLGPLFHYFIIDSGWQEWLHLAPFHELHSEWTAWRNIVVVRFLNPPYCFVHPF